MPSLLDGYAISDDKRQPVLSTPQDKRNDSGQRSGSRVGFAFAGYWTKDKKYYTRELYLQHCSSTRRREEVNVCV